jgi:hypothetical protein
MPSSRTLYIQNILNRSLFKPRKLFVVEEILVPTYEHPYVEW